MRSTLAGKIDATRKEVKALLAEHGDRKISDVTVAQAYGGMRGVKCMVTETSAVDPVEGIRFRGYTIPQLQERLPRAPGGEEPLPEGVFYLLATGDLPTESDVRAITAEWRAAEALPDPVKRALEAMPADTHPMTQFSMGILAMQRESKFAQCYRDGKMTKDDQWKTAFDDAMTILGRLPTLAAFIYRRTYKNGKHVPAAPKDLDWGANLAQLMGVEAPAFREMMRLYLAIHADHEGGNVSAHATHLVGSSLSDPYYALSAGINGLAGPLHGLANQEVIRWIMDMKEKLGTRTPSREQIERYVWTTLESGQVVPGYGHAVLRATDPRYTAQRKFALAHLPDDENFQIVKALFEIVPAILESQGKAKNPWPNVDAHSGCLLVHYGVVEFDFYTVLFGVSRAMGVLASYVWDRALHLPIERPKSVTTAWMKEQVSKPSPV